VFFQELPTMGSKRAKGYTLEEVIRARIKALGLSFADVSRMSGVDASVVQRLVKGQRTVTLRVAQKLCDALGLVLVVKGEQK
jgi:transcriptional regulator with XRE-family HTH domain